MHPTRDTSSIVHIQLMFQVHIDLIDAYTTHASGPCTRSILTLNPSHMVEGALDDDRFGHWKRVSG